jgi:bleomycin hydrolase
MFVNDLSKLQKYMVALKQNKTLLFALLILVFAVPNLSAQKELPYCPPLDSFLLLGHTEPVSQGFTGTCWSYAMVSLLESEHLRLYGDTLKLSEMWFAYCDFEGKMDRALANRNDTFVEGSQCNSVLRYIESKGAVPAYAYLGRKAEAKFFDYSTMFEELQAWVKKVKQNKRLKDAKAKSKYLKILNYTMGVPPALFYDTNTRKEISPKEYAQTKLKLNPGDYYSFMSNGLLPFGQRGLLQEPDNWWMGNNYYNLPINQFLSAIKEALVHGYSVVVSGDVTEKSYQPHIPYSWYCNDGIANIDSVRVVEKLDKKTEDDHSWHIVGYYPSKEGWWFYIKDSAFWDDPVNGYHFIHESYLTRKAVSMFMHKYAARSVVNSIIK